MPSIVIFHRSHLSQKPVLCCLHCILRFKLSAAQCISSAMAGSFWAAQSHVRELCPCAGLCESLAPPLATFGIGLSLVEPGPVSTPFMENIPKNAEKAAAAHEEAKGELDEVT